MEIDTMFTEKPLFIIVKDYENNNPKIEDLTEVFSVTYRVQLPNYKEVPDATENLKNSLRYNFFTDLEKAFKQYKYYGPRGAVIARIFTDKDELIELAQKSNFEVIPDDDEKEDFALIEENGELTVKIPELETNEEKEELVNKQTYDA